jgi:hypothetical protein
MPNIYTKNVCIILQKYVYKLPFFQKKSLGSFTITKGIFLIFYYTIITFK